MGYNEKAYNDAAISRDGGGFTDRAFRRYPRRNAGGCVLGLQSTRAYAAETERQQRKAVLDRHSSLLPFPDRFSMPGCAMVRRRKARASSSNEGQSQDIRASTPSGWRGEEDSKSLDLYVIDKPAVTITNILGRQQRLEGTFDPWIRAEYRWRSS